MKWDRIRAAAGRQRQEDQLAADQASRRGGARGRRRQHPRPWACSACTGRMGTEHGEIGGVAAGTTIYTTLDPLCAGRPHRDGPAAPRPRAADVGRRRRHRHRRQERWGQAARVQDADRPTGRRSSSPTQAPVGDRHRPDRGGDAGGGHPRRRTARPSRPSTPSTATPPTGVHAGRLRGSPPAGTSWPTDRPADVDGLRRHLASHTGGDDGCVHARRGGRGDAAAMVAELRDAVTAWTTDGSPCTAPSSAAAGPTGGQRSGRRSWSICMISMGASAPG